MTKISVVVPVFNMVNTIEQTLDSIWQQNYQNLQLIVVDGWSTDGTKEFLDKNSSKIDILISEKDNGQYHAIQKGMNLVDGEVVSWLNADDVYFPWTFKTVDRCFAMHSSIDWIAGLPSFLDAEGDLSHTHNNLSSRPRNTIRKGGFRRNVYGYLQQESMFYKKSLWDSVGGLNLDYELASDFELWLKFADKTDIVAVNLPLAAFRIDYNSRSKRLVNDYEKEVISVLDGVGSYFKIIELISKVNSFNRLIRSLIWRKQKIIYYSISRREWIYKSAYRPISTMSLSNLLMEANSKRYTN